MAPTPPEPEPEQPPPPELAAEPPAIKVKRAAVLAAEMQRGGGGGLAAAMDAVLPLQASRVDLTGFDFGSDDGVMVGTVVAWMKSEPSALTSLTLDWDKACGRVREAVLDVARTTRTLVALSVGEDGAMPLNPLQLCGREALLSLDLSRKGLGPGSAAVVAAGLSVNAVLTSLDVGGNCLTEEAALGIVRVELQRNKLFSLGLAGCDIGPTGAAEVAEYVSGSEVLANLDLSFNCLTEEATLGIVRVERQRNKLTSLGLARCRIGPTCAAEIEEYVSGSAVLTNLNLNRNSIGPEGAKAIGKALEVNEVLTIVDLEGNKIRDEGAAALGKALAELTRC